MIRIYDREKKEYYDETQYGEKALNFLYKTAVGRVLLKIAVSKGFSNLERRRKDSARSVREIEPFIEKYGIRCEDFEEREYSSFNDFFTRRHADGKRNVCMNDGTIISPADAKLRVYEISDDLKINVKRSVYTVGALLGDEELARRFSGGMCFVYRLTVDDCHRYCFTESGNVRKAVHLDGVLHTVSSISEEYDVYTHNAREYCLIETNLGGVIQMEVGAMLVGRIVNKEVKTAVRGEEKGYFSYGGSTIIVMYEKGRVKADGDIMDNSKTETETKVKYGESVGRTEC